MKDGLAGEAAVWIGGALLVVLGLLTWVWFTGPTVDVLPLVYSVL